MADLRIPDYSMNDRQRFIDQTDTEINSGVEFASCFTSTLAFNIWYARYQTLHLAKYGSYLLLGHEIYDNVENINNDIISMDDEIFEF